MPDPEVKIAKVLSDRGWKTLQLLQTKGGVAVQKQMNKGG